MSRLGARLKELRGTLSLFDIEKEIGIPRGELSRYERGQYPPTPRNLKRLAEFFEVSYQELRILYYDDFFSEPEERAIVIEWAKQQ